VFKYGNVLLYQMKKNVVLNPQLKLKKSLLISTFQYNYTDFFINENKEPVQ